MKRILPLILLISLLFLGSCSAVKPLNVISKPVDRVPLTVYDPQKVELEKVVWVVITKDNFQEVLNELEERGLYPVVFALSGKDYKALAVNMQEIKRFMLLQKQIIDAYRSYYERE